jgi:hypothetical protein
MDGGKTAECRMILDSDMACERCVINEDDVVADLAIMRDMGAGEEKTMAPHAGYMTAAFGAAIHGDMLTNRVVTANHKPALLASILPILRRSAKDREGVNFAAVSNFGPPADDRMRVNLNRCTKRHIGPYDGEGADLGPAPKLRIGIDRR